MSFALAPVNLAEGAAHPWAWSIFARGAGYQVQAFPNPARLGLGVSEVASCVLKKLDPDYLGEDS